MPDLIRDSRLRDPNSCALRTTAGEISYTELDNRVDQCVTRFIEDGVHRGDRVAFQSGTQIEYVIAFWAIQRLGATFCPINPRWPDIAVSEATRRVAAARTYRAGDHGGSLVAARTPGHERTMIERSRSGPHCPATILFSSGSTGKPKAIAHGLSAHVASATGANLNMPLQNGDAWLLSLPLFHVAGVAILVRCAAVGACVCVPDLTAPLETSVQALAPSHLSLIPTQLRQLLRHLGRAPDQLRGVLLGGAPLPAALVDNAVQQRWPIATSYGLTEMASQVSATRVGRATDLRTAGRCLAGREIFTAPDGEICVRGDTLFAGYVEQDAIVPQLDVDGWFHTGDRGAIDTEGRLCILGRIDNMFISGGENIYPEEIEQQLVAMETIADAIVIPVPNDQYGHRPVAFVQTVEGSNADEQRWRRELEVQLPKFKIPDHFFPWPEQTGLKPDRKQLVSLATRRIAKNDRLNR